MCTGKQGEAPRQTCRGACAGPGREPLRDEELRRQQEQCHGTDAGSTEQESPQSDS
ncbi:hypothetical protein GSbR_18350 [Geobacter sp. SVR]|nr:hypothetical protein GSVR_33610 [Geobacter sp. SVR]GCF85235.1 hypothetical protein GSbR_18350 [Geobacter sp. SVR]